MNNSYYSPTMNNYSTSYDYSYEYASPAIPDYYNSPLITPSCPVHSPYHFYTSSTSMNLSPFSSTYYPQQQPQVYPSPPVQQHPIIPPAADRTPLRRHKCFKKNELQVLHQAYLRDPHPSTDALQRLAIQLNVTVDKVRQWFKNRRHTDKQKKREIPTARTSTTT